MQVSILSRVIFVILCFMLIWVPIPLGSNRAWAWGLLQVLIGLTFALHLVHCWTAQTALFAARKFWLALSPLALLLLWLTLQSLQILPTADAYQTTIMAGKTLFFILWCSLLLNYCDSHKRIRLLAIVIVISGALQAFYGVVIQLANFDSSPIIGMGEAGRARGSFVYQNHFANYLALSLSVAIGLLISQLSSERTQRTWHQLFRDILSTMLSSKMMLRLAMILMVIGLVMSRSRMGNAAFFTSLILVAVLAMWFYKRPPALLKPLVVSILLLDMVLVSSMFGLEKLQERYQDTSFVSEARDEVVRDSLPLLSEHAWTGSGGGTFYTVFPAVRPGAYNGFYDHAHNDYLQFAIELGVPLTLLLLLWLIWLAFLALQVMRTHDHKLERGLSFAALMALLHMAMHSTVDFSLQAPANALLFLTILMLILICHALPEKVTRRRSSSMPSV
ncbi:MAG: O-antigen ligase domain-containing protein [Rheinheimera sp.]|nr:MAG: O-antigen ligase domain-containing protein [Rheinheimera sp.]